MPIVHIPQDVYWDNPWVAPPLLISTSDSVVYGQLYVWASSPPSTWMIGYRPARVLVHLSSVYGSPIIVTGTAWDALNSVIGTNTVQILPGAQATLAVNLTFGSSDIDSLNILVTDTFSTPVNAAAVVNSIGFAASMFWTSIHDCVESA